MLEEKGLAKRQARVLGSSSGARFFVSALAPPGAVPVVGGYLYPSVLRFSGVSPQKCRVAHGPRDPAVTNPLSLLLGFMFGSLLGMFGIDVGFSVWFFVSEVRMMFGLVPLTTRPLYAMMFVDLSLFSSLSQVLGNTKPSGVCVSPSVLLPGRAQRPRPALLRLHLHQGLRPAFSFATWFVFPVVVGHCLSGRCWVCGVVFVEGGFMYAHVMNRWKRRDCQTIFSHPNYHHCCF